MLNRQDLINRREEILAIAARHGASNFRIFGSVARGDAIEASDLDFIVKLDSDRSLLDHAQLIGELEDLLGAKVDIIDEDGMRPRFREVVEREALPL